MTNTTKSNMIYTQSTAQASSNPFVDVYMQRDPVSTDINYPVQKKWFNTVSNTFWILEGFTTSSGVVSANWVNLTPAGTSAISKMGVDANTPPGTNPVLPDGTGKVTVTGGQIAAGSTPNVIRTDSLAANTYTVEIQRSQAVGSSTVGDNGVCHFDSGSFTVDSNGFVQLVGSPPTLSFDIDAHTAPGTNPVVPNGSGIVTITGGQVASGTTTNVIRTDSLAANTYTVEVQRSTAVGSSTVGDNGVCHFNSSQFSVDGNGFVQFTGGAVTESFQVDAHTGPGTNPVLPNASGVVTVTGGQVPAGTTPNVIQTDSLAANTYTVQVQRSQAVSSSTVADNGVCHFKSSDFAVDSNGFVSLVSSPSGSFNQINNQVFTTSGTYTPSSGMKYASVQCLGGGGAGGGSDATGGLQYSVGSGGGAGEYAVGIFSASTIGVSQTVTVGAGGTGVSAGNGGNGGTSSLGALISSHGGSGGLKIAAGSLGNQPGGLGGTGGSGGDYRAAGGAGMYGQMSFTASLGLSGMGGTSQLGGNGNTQGSSAVGFGAGGFGSATSASGAAKAGGNGAPGVIIVTEYIST